MKTSKQRQQASWSKLRNTANYVRVERPFANFHPLMDYVVVKEELAQTSRMGLILLNKDHTKVGTVLKVGDRAQAMVPDLVVGDRIVYVEYVGGRWAFPDPTQPDGVRKVLLMEWMDIEARIHECEHAGMCECPGHPLEEIPLESQRPFLKAG
jgi:co-chaperonin GroES (HSP10)